MEVFKDGDVVRVRGTNNIFEVYEVASGGPGSYFYFDGRSNTGWHHTEIVLVVSAEERKDRKAKP